MRWGFFVLEFLRPQPPTSCFAIEQNSGGANCVRRIYFPADKLESSCPI